MPTRADRRRARLFAHLLAAAALFAGASPASAQAVSVSGRVVDAATGRPLAGVRIHVESPDRRTVTDSTGAFTLAQLEPGLYAAMVRHMGYAERREDLIAAAGQEPVTIRLSADPVLLEALTVQVNRFDRRRNALPFRVQTIRRREFENAFGSNARETILQRVGLVPCGGADRDCVRVRGRNARVNLVIDERPAVAGMAELELMDPIEIYMVESYGGGAQIRVYTVDFMERAARMKMIPEPIQF